VLTECCCSRRLCWSNEARDENAATALFCCPAKACAVSTVQSVVLKAPDDCSTRPIKFIVAGRHTAKSSNDLTETPRPPLTVADCLRQKVRQQVKNTTALPNILAVAICSRGLSSKSLYRAATRSKAAFAASRIGVEAPTRHDNLARNVLTAVAHRVRSIGTDCEPEH
jgi:hypothetical protein